MRYKDNGDPADLEAAYRWIEKAGYGYALEPIQEYIAMLEQPSYHDLDFVRCENIKLRAENADLRLKIRKMNAEQRGT